MVEFEYQPWKKIIFHEVVKYPLEFFLSQHSLKIPSGGIGRPLQWADGIVFDLAGIRATDDIVKEQLEGKIHYASIVYGLLEKHQPEFRVKEGNIRIPVIDVSNNKIFREMAAWIKRTFEKK